MNYVELHIGDYEKATAHLTATEDGIYGRLLRRYYDTEEPLPADLKAVQRLVRARTRDEKEAVETVLEEFFQPTDGGWRHKRCDEEIARYQAKREKAQASANARWNRQQEASARNANASTDAMRTHSEGNARQSPVTRHQKEQIPPALTDPGAEPSASARPDALPEGTDPAAWDAFEQHHQQLGRWSIARRRLAVGQLRVIADAGGDPTSVLTWATTRGLADLADAARRMAADAAKESTDARRKRPGESLADHAARLHREHDDRDDDARALGHD